MVLSEDDLMGNQCLFFFLNIIYIRVMIGIVGVIILFKQLESQLIFSIESGIWKELESISFENCSSWHIEYLRQVYMK